MFFKSRKKNQAPKLTQPGNSKSSDKEISLFLSGKPLPPDSDLAGALRTAEKGLQQDRYNLENSNKVSVTRQEARFMITNWELNLRKKRRQTFVLATMFSTVFVLVFLVGVAMLTAPTIQPVNQVGATASPTPVEQIIVPPSVDITLETPAPTLPDATPTPTLVAPTATPSPVLATATPSLTIPTVTPSVVASTATPSPTATTAPPVVPPTNTPEPPVTSGKLVYETYSETDPEIFTINPDGTGRKKIGDGQSPVFSPDGKQIAFGKVISGEFKVRPFQTAIVRTDLNGQNEQKLCPAAVTNRLSWPQRWSPSGRFIAFMPVILDVDAGGLLSLCNPTTNSVIELKRPQDFVRNVFDWSLDGNYAIWQVGESISDGKKVKSDIYYGDPDLEGKEAFLLASNQKDPSIALDFQGGRFAPDNKTIALSTYEKISFVSVPGQKSPLEGKTIQMPTGMLATTVAFSPDGKKLAVLVRLFPSEPASNYRKRVIRFISLEAANFGEISKLPGDEIYVSSFDWSRR